MATRPTTPTMDDQDDENARNRELDLQQEQQNYADTDVQSQRATDTPEPVGNAGPEQLAQADAPTTPAPEQVAAAAPDLTPNAAGVNTFTREDIASKALEAAQPAAATDDPQSDVYQLMQQRYHSDPAAVAQQLAAATSGQAADGGTANLAAPGQAGAPSMESMLQNRLVEMMGRSATPSASDPEIAAALQASNVAGQRAFDRDSAAMAERMAYNGMSGSGATESGLAGLRQARAESEQKISADLFKDAANRRIAELQNTLQLAGGLLDAKQQRAMQLQIAQLQDATDRAQIGEGGRQFDQGLAEKIREYGLDAAYRDAALGASGSAQGAALDQRRYEFDKNLDWEKEQFPVLHNENSFIEFMRNWRPSVEE